jgi:hypothetical protein
MPNPQVRLQRPRTAGQAGFAENLTFPSSCQMPAGFARKFADHFPAILHKLSALFYQKVRSPDEFRRDFARDREDHAARIYGKPGGHGRSAVSGAFHDHYANAHAGDDAVSYGKVLGKSDGAHGKFGNEQSLSGYWRCQFVVFGGVDHIDAATENGDRVAAGCKRAQAARGIDAARDSAYDRDAGMRQIPAESALPQQGVGRRAPTRLERSSAANRRGPSAQSGARDRNCRAAAADAMERCR